MVMTYDKYIDKLYSMMESTICEYDICVLTEEADPNADAAATEKKKGNLWAGFKKLLAQAWARFKEFVHNIYLKMTRIQDEAKITVAYDKETVNKVCDRIARLTALLAGGAATTLDADSAKTNSVGDIGKSVETTYTVREAKKILATIEVKTDRLLKTINKIQENTDNSGILQTSKELHTEANKIVTAFSESIRAAVDHTKKAKKYGQTQEDYEAAFAAAKKTKEATDAMAKNDATAKNESASKLGRMADLLVEASKVYRTGKSDIADLHISRILNEASEILLEADDDADDASVIIAADQADIDKGMETQEPVEDIPEEDPVDAAEYDPETNGGEGEKIDMEEFKDVIGDDAEAIAIMTDDDGSTVVESVVIDFGI